jgi:hypothetical protein
MNLRWQRSTRWYSHDLDRNELNEEEGVAEELRRRVPSEVPPALARDSGNARKRGGPAGSRETHGEAEKHQGNGTA